MSRDTPQLLEKVKGAARELGIQIFMDMPVSHVRPEHRIREFCYENKCGNYGAHYMCPPHIGTIDELAQRIRSYTSGLLLQYTKRMDVASEPLAVTISKLQFHERILQLEELLKKNGITELWGLIGGDCALCEPCKAMLAEPCLYPARARTSLESIGIDVIALLNELGLDSRFHDDRITWTGCILYNAEVLEDW